MFSKLTHACLPSCVFILAFTACTIGAQAKATHGFTQLYTFCQLPNCADGSTPAAGPVADRSGNLYGTTVSGGASNNGAVFKVTPTGAETVLYSFCSQTNCTDGANPNGPLVIDSSGNLYGTTFDGGFIGQGCGGGCGTVFKVAPDGVETVIYAFCSTVTCDNQFGDAQYPRAGVVMDKSGNLYGTTNFGGSGQAGTVYKITPGGTESILYDFAQQPNDGAAPQSVLLLKNGNLYGTTISGGSGANCPSLAGCGVVFKVNSKGVETVLHSFCAQTNCADGLAPVAGLVMDNSGNLYGTTSTGGNYYGSNVCGSYGCGVIFEVSPTGVENVLYAFCAQANCADGATPTGGLLLKSSLTGITLYGNAGGGTQGVTYELKGNTETVLHDFQPGPSPPIGGLILKNRYFYGATSENNNGSVFKLGTLGGVR